MSASIRATHARLTGGLARVLDELDVAVCAIDGDGTVSWMNRRAIERHGDLVGRRFTTVAVAPARSSAAELTPRQLEVLRLLAQGLGTGAISTRLRIADETTRNHIRAVLKKLGVHSRLEAVAVAYERGLVEAPS
jgi:DNA-binding NarL/FixJ family response regulator